MQTVGLDRKTVIVVNETVDNIDAWEKISGIEVNFIEMDAELDTNNGTVADGYISGATVFIDLDRDGELDIETEPFTMTDEYGNYSMKTARSDAPIIAFGGTDISTNTLFNGTLSAPKAQERSSVARMLRYSAHA